MSFQEQVFPPLTDIAPQIAENSLLKIESLESIENEANVAGRAVNVTGSVVFNVVGPDSGGGTKQRHNAGVAF
jgi:hypothetical protein